MSIGKDRKVCYYDIAKLKVIKKMKKKRKKKEFIIIIIILIIIFGFVIWNIWLLKSIIETKTQAVLTERQEGLAKSVDERMVNKVSENKDIIINSPKKEELISSPLVITGQVNGNGWSGFEGQVGTVKLLGSNAEILGTAILEPTTDWMRLPTKFKAILVFASAKEQNGMLVFKNENPSGMPENDTEFKLPVKIGNTQ